MKRMIIKKRGIAAVLAMVMICAVMLQIPAFADYSNDQAGLNQAKSDISKLKQELKSVLKEIKDMQKEELDEWKIELKAATDKEKKKYIKEEMKYIKWEYKWEIKETKLDYKCDILYIQTYMKVIKLHMKDKWTAEKEDDLWDKFEKKIDKWWGD